MDTQRRRLKTIKTISIIAIQKLCPGITMVMGHPRRHMRHTHDFKYYNKVSKHLQTNLYQNHTCSFIYTIKFKQVTGNKNFTNGAEFKIIPTSGSLPLFPAPFQHSG